jgi:tetratricopeptide (TPR) repeat protein
MRSHRWVESSKIGVVKAGGGSYASNSKELRGKCEVGRLVLPLLGSVKEEAFAMSGSMPKIVLLVAILLGFCGCSGQRDQAGTEGLPDFDQLWDYDHPDSTEAAFRSLLPAAEKSQDASYHARLLTQIARAQGLQMNFAGAHHTLDSVEAVLTEDMVVGRIRYLLERGRVHNSSGQADSAKPYFLEAWELARSAEEDFYAVDAAHMMAIVEPPEEQLGWAERAMQAAEESPDERARRWLGALYNNTGWTYHDMGQYQKALGMFEKALAWNREHGTEEQVRIARWTVARAHRSLGHVEEALALQKQLESEIEEKELETDGYVFEEIAECLLLLGRKEEAKAYFALAHEHLSRDPWLVANQAERLARLKRLSE